MQTSFFRWNVLLPSVVALTSIMSHPSSLQAQENLLTPEQATSKEATPTKEEPATKEDVGYVVGYQLGAQLGQSGFSLDDFSTQGILKGISDALGRKKPSLTQEKSVQVGKHIDSLLNARNQEMKAKIQSSAKTNLEKSEKFLAENAKKDGVQTLKSGLQYSVVKKGSGKSPGLTSEVKVHYEGKLINGEVFDSSLKRGEPAEFPVNGVIPGWTEALQRMVVGDKWMLFIPPKLAYGERGSQNAIGPNEALVFEVELLEIVK